jgi:hypothetical protein
MVRKDAVRKNMVNLSCGAGRRAVDAAPPRCLE